RALSLAATIRPNARIQGGPTIKGINAPQRKREPMPSVRPSEPLANSTSPYLLRSQTVLWMIAILLAVIATTLIVRSGGSPFALPSAYADTPMAGARGIFAFTGQIDV